MLRERKKTVYFATGNKGKFSEASLIARAHGMDLRHLRIEKEEIQSEDLARIASYAAERAAKSTHKVVVAEDAGFFVRYLGGFPGPYSSYVFDTVGVEGILKLMRGIRPRTAAFRASVAYCEPGGRSLCFNGIVDGSLAHKPIGSRGFGFDPIFIPKGGDGRTFAQMGPDEKNLFSHRAKAFNKFCKWFKLSSP
jgi:XTP/dITP diphosphohydrolase